MEHPWSIAFASVVGTSHRETGLPCQDFSRCEVLVGPWKTEVLVAVACDGAGSALHSDLGADFVGESFISSVSQFLLDGFSVSDLDYQWAASWIEDLHHSLDSYSIELSTSRKQLACTFTGVICDQHSTACLQIGDGLIVVLPESEPDDYLWMFWPSRGEYANETDFITQDNATSNLQLEVSHQSFLEFAILTDGLLSLAVNIGSQEVHQPFFRPIFQTLQLQHQYATPISDLLGNFLLSESVSSRTDDDKTLILVSRRSEV